MYGTTHCPRRIPTYMYMQLHVSLVAIFTNYYAVHVSSNCLYKVLHKRHTWERCRFTAERQCGTIYTDCFTCNGALVCASAWCDMFNRYQRTHKKKINGKTVLFTEIRPRFTLIHELRCMEGKKKEKETHFD